ncbi:cobalamin-binding protein [Thiohalophilus thiocyanatoxydans]|uniref:Iron complex transport system substrate-binding protein n=1 Tax=Thiohalophilus thiocyanatoxydans TaxID=381308 RepID=A0A4R8IMW5_9GAMM|nr:cobalamin-binding protein [Thiohalophilus thiocyanatoxydans]TDX97895.1 iron complex transport system substrate-binding protein [Thiohalophilus thiocyanatoxydans]
MKSRLIAIIGLCLLVGFVSAGTRSVTDYTGQQVRLEQPAQRIVSLAPHVTELLFSIGAGERLVGAVNYSDYPEAAESIPRVGGYNALDLERIVTLKPDLVVGWESGNNPADLEKLRRFDLPLFINEPRRLMDIPETLRRLAVLTGTEQQAETVIADFKEKLKRLERFSERQPVDVFYQIWDRPLMTVNNEHLIGDVIRLCGGRNVFGKTTSLTPQISEEAVIARAPQAIVIGGMGEQHAEWLERWRRWQQMPAVRHDHLFMINPDHLQRHTVRILQGAETLCRQLEQVRSR